MPQFVNEGLPDLVSHFGFSGTNRFNIPLVQDDVIGSGWNIEKALSCPGYAMKYPQEQLSRSPWRRRRLVRREIFDKNGNVADSAAKLARKRVQSVFRDFDEFFSIHGLRPDVVVICPA